MNGQCVYNKLARYKYGSRRRRAILITTSTLIHTPYPPLTKTCGGVTRVTPPLLLQKFCISHGRQRC